MESRRVFFVAHVSWIYWVRTEVADDEEGDEEIHFPPHCAIAWVSTGLWLCERVGRSQHVWCFFLWPVDDAVPFLWSLPFSCKYNENWLIDLYCVYIVGWSLFELMWFQDFLSLLLVKWYTLTNLFIWVALCSSLRTKDVGPKSSYK